MDPFTLGAVAAALVAKAEDTTAERAVGAAADALGRVVGWLRDRCSASNDEAGARALDRVKDVPDSPTLIKDLGRIVGDRANYDGEFRSALEALVAEAGAAGVNIGSIAQTAIGDQNVQNAGVSDSEIHVTYAQAPPTSRS